MKHEDKELLLGDLCGRLPHGVKLNMKGLIGVSHHTTILYGKNTEMYFRYGCNDYFINEIKPYLFPLSSMTDEQKQELDGMFELDLNIAKKCVINETPNIVSCLNRINWLDKNHFDYRGLIEKGLAIDATGLNIY